jgi:hypothetical protein
MYFCFRLPLLTWVVVTHSTTLKPKWPLLLPMRLLCLASSRHTKPHTHAEVARHLHCFWLLLVVDEIIFVVHHVLCCDAGTNILEADDRQAFLSRRCDFSSTMTNIARRTDKTYNLPLNRTIRSALHGRYEPIQRGSVHYTYRFRDVLIDRPAQRDDVMRNPRID